MRSHTRVRHILEDKGEHVVAIAAGASARDCARHMADHDVGSLLVLADNRVVGIVTWHDVVAAIADRGERLFATTAADLMTPLVETTSEDEELEEVEARMAAKGIHHLPVIRGAHVVGVITLLDVLRLHLSRSDALGQQLVDYISGCCP